MKDERADTRKQAAQDEFRKFALNLAATIAAGKRAGGSKPVVRPGGKGRR